MRTTGGFCLDGHIYVFCSVDPLLFTINSKSNKSGYESLAINLFEFKMIDSVPMDNRLDRLDEE